MDQRVKDFRTNKHQKEVTIIYVTKKKFYEISDILVMDNYKVSIISIYSRDKENEISAHTEVALSVTLKRRTIDSFVEHLLKDDKCISIYILDAKEKDYLIEDF